MINDKFKTGMAATIILNYIMGRGFGFLCILEIKSTYKPAVNLLPIFKILNLKPPKKQPAIAPVQNQKPIFNGWVQHKGCSHLKFSPQHNAQGAVRSLKKFLD